MKGDLVTVTIDHNTQRTIKTLVGSVEKQFGKGAIMAMGEEQEGNDIRIIPTGAIALDHALGVGGYDATLETRA
jgi:recombination protein RecA